MFLQQGDYLACFLLSISIVLFVIPASAVSTHIHPTQEQIDQHPESEYIEGELLVKFKPGTTDEEKAAVHGELGSTVLKVFKSIGVEHIKLREGLSVEEAIRLYTEDPHVKYAEPNYKARIQGGSQ